MTFFDHKFSRRQRLLATAALSSTAILILIFLIFFLAAGEKETYRPGEDIEGITANLARNLPADYPRITFTEVAETAGISFHHFQGKRTAILPEDMGSGAAWGDYDNDGWQDVFIVNLLGPLSLSSAEKQAARTESRLYRNNGDGTFSDVTRQSGIKFKGMGSGAAWADIENDGDRDLLITAYGENVFYINNGDGTFTEATKNAGLGGITGFWASATWGDFNNDNFLDVHVSGYVKFVYHEGMNTESKYDIENPPSINPSSFKPERNLLYKNNGDGTFSEIAAKAGVLNDAGRSLSAAWADFDKDGWLDLYVANDVSDNVFFHNNHDDTFSDISHNAWVADYRGAMGIAVGDWNQDTNLDMFVTHWIAQENALYNNIFAQLPSTGGKKNAPVKFMDVADRFGLGQIALDFIGWGTSFFDYNNDGRVDLFIANGSTLQDRSDPSKMVPMENLLFWNRNNDEGFYDVSKISGKVFHQKNISRGAAFADYDRDGDVDILLINHGGRAQLLRNDGGNKQNWLQVKLHGKTCNRDAIGAWIELYAGGVTQVRQIGAQSSYMSQNSLVEHFGLGQANVVDSLKVIWPGGDEQRFQNVKINTRFSITQGEPKPAMN